MQAVASGEAKVKEVVRPDGVGRQRNYLGSAGAIANGPQAFLVERPYANAIIHPHFHDVDQFQIVVAGDGRMGKKAVKPVTLQYADAYTPYGPIVANDQGISFFTLRPVASGGHFKMPGNRHRMPCRAGRNIAAGFDADRPLQAGAVELEPLLEAEADGVAAVGIRFGADATTRGVPSDAGGQYYLVCAGTLVDGERALGVNSLIHVAPGEAAPMLIAGADGASVLMVQFARASERPGSDVSLLANRDPKSYVTREQ
jgi:hypothetical protein